MRMVDPILMELEQEAQTTRRVLDRVPEAKLGWKPHAKSRSLGELALHIANVPGKIAGMAQVDEFQIGPNPDAAPKDRQEILDVLTKSVATAKDLIGKMDDARLMSNWTASLNGKVVMTMPRIGVLRFIMLNHWYHHRGQLTFCLRELDVPLPSVYGPSADENPFMQ